LNLTGTLILDAQHNPDAVFIIRSGGYLSTAASSKISLINQANASNVFFIAGGYVSLGASAIFAGNILANSYVTLGADATVHGHVFSKDSYVTFGANSTSTPPLSPARIPAIGSVTPAVGGFTATIGNDDSTYTWTGTATNGGSVAISAEGFITVTGVAANTSATAIINSVKAGSADGSQTVTAIALNAPVVVPEVVVPVVVP
jgi:hypothetical protein